MEGKPLVLAQLGVAGVVVFVGLMALYGGFSPGEPPPRPKPPPPPSQFVEGIKCSAPIYRAGVEDDAKKFHVNVPTEDELAQPIPYFDEIRGKRRLRPGKPIETRHLKVTLKVEKRQATVDGQSFRVEHLVLEIKNNTSKYLAYRVVTAVPNNEKCITKGDIPHNAIVIAPGLTVERSECLYKDSDDLDLLSVEVMEVLPLSAYYLSRLPPSLVLYDARTASGHVPLAGSVCRQTVNWQAIRKGVETNQFSWKDLMDYYARHDCEEFAFYDSYRYREDPKAALPSCPDSP